MLYWTVKIVGNTNLESSMNDSNTPWYVDFFGSDYQEAYGHIFTMERTEKEVLFVERTLGLSSNSRLLDLCCGQGRHSVLLASHGLKVTGQDLSREYLEQAGRSAKEQGVHLDLLCNDMRDIPFKDHFDAVINMFSAFGYLESDEENLKVLKAVREALKPGGRVLLDMINREWVVSNYDQSDWRQGEDGTLYLEHRELDLVTSRNHVTFTIVKSDGSRRDTVGHHIRLYTLTETLNLLSKAGLDFVEVYGGFDGEAYSIDTRRMIVVAQKRQL